MTATELVQAYLRGITNVRVVRKVPTTRPDLFIRVDQSAPRRSTPITDTTLVIVQVYGTDLEAVIDLIDQLREAMFDMEHDRRVLGWDEEAGPVEFPDPDIPQHRWQFTGQLIQALR